MDSHASLTKFERADILMLSSLILSITNSDVIIFLEHPLQVHSEFC